MSKNPPPPALFTYLENYGLFSDWLKGCSWYHVDYGLFLHWPICYGIDRYYVFNWARARARWFG